MHPLAALFFFPLFGSGIAIYFLPSIIAFAKSKRDTAAILLLNIFLGWTVIGWVVALVWAAKTDSRRSRSWLWHAGHIGGSALRTSSSNG